MRRIYVLFLLTASFNLYAGEIVLKGVYSGRDVYIKNPYNPDTGTFCTDRVYVNDISVVESPQASAFRVDLSHLKNGSLVVIRIEFADGCQPQIVNPQVLSISKGFRFLQSQASNNSIDWKTEGENNNGQFIIEQEIYHADRTITWEKVSEVTAKGNPLINDYSVSPNHYPGENKYRIRYDSPERESIYSVEIMYTSTKSPITFYPISVTTKITLSEFTNFQVSDRNGRILKTGSAKTIQVHDLRPGEYFLHIQNRTEKFVKK